MVIVDCTPHCDLEPKKYGEIEEFKTLKEQSSLGLYDPRNEHEACGVGFIVAIDGKRSHKILRDAKTLSERMKHRGACACDNDTGDGAGVLTAIPHNFYEKEMKLAGVNLPEYGRYATGIFFLDEKSHLESEKGFNQLANELGVHVLGWRTVPINKSAIGTVARNSEPLSRQVFVTVPDGEPNVIAKKIFVLRKRATHELVKEGVRFYICSLSTKVIVYKGLFTSDQLWDYYVDLMNPDFDSYLTLVHTRFSTNTFPSWERAHPLRVLAHNGEINTVRGNVNFMKAREGVMKSDIFGDDLKKLFPVVEPGLSDSGSADCVLEFLTVAGNRSLPEAVMTMIPEAWQNDKTMPQEKRDFYQWSSCVMEPWDGPALISFTDGRYIGAILDRNGLRPSRFYVTKDNILVMASEVGVYDIDPANIVLKSRLKPGRMLLVDTEEKTLIQDVELKSNMAKSRPHTEWLKKKMTLEEFHKANANSHTGNILKSEDSLLHEKGIFDPRLSQFGYTTETINLLLLPMFKNKKEALGSMGNDAPLACLSNFQPLPYEYFKQLFAQVTNPPIDPFREKIVMSLQCPIGPEYNLLQPSEQQVHRLWLETPILSLADLKMFKKTNHRGWKSKVLDITFPYVEGITGYCATLRRTCLEGQDAAEKGYQLLILSDKNCTPGRASVSALLALGSLHHHLIETRQRMKVGIIVETAEAREVHQICVLLGYGADAICPYLAFELATSLRDDGVISSSLTDKELYSAYSQAIGTGISKVMAKMGISTLQSYKGAQIFEAVGFAPDVIDYCFRGTQSRLGGVDLKTLAKEGLERYELTSCIISPSFKILRNPGQYHWRQGGEAHINEPTSIANLQEAAIRKDQSAYEKFRSSTLESVKECTIRGQLELVSDCQKIDISLVEPASEIVKRFATGAMSFGSISLEAHTTLAVAMNQIGGKSNTGEGGEGADRYLDQGVDNNKRSAIKQVASGRFGVNAAYLANADDLQIKMAQGAKPGEGGELPGYKVTEDIALVRHSVPGVGLISPPPHHDIYSIEDLAELIYDLKCSNPKARISVKLVSEVGVGVVAAGVAKGKAEHIVISGHDGGTGASSWTGIKSAGLPWELGIAEAHQVLVLNNLRSRIVLQADGQLRTGFDVAVAAILGADEFGFSTAPLIVMGCTMMRKCHLNTCPVGIATQDPILRAKFAGKPEHVVNFFFMLAEDIRQIMANLGLRKFQDLIGRTDLLKVRKDCSPKASHLNFDLLLKNALELRPDTNIIGGSIKQNFELDKRADNYLISQAQSVFSGLKENINIFSQINNEERAFGSTLSYHIATKFGESGLPEGRSININLEGSAGQSFCAFLVRGVNITLKGDSNDYVGKGLSGGTITISPPETSQFESHLNVIVGNVCLYGATEGKAFFRGIAAERFCVRNSGAVAVVEGVGDHGCEYMTGGLVVILGLTGRNFAAGMSGGIAYVYDIDGSFESKVNPESVELLPVSLSADKELLQNLLNEFIEKTGSLMAKSIVSNWENAIHKFVKVFPYEYQKALKAIEDNKHKVEIPKPIIDNNIKQQGVSNIQDIEEAIQDITLKKNAVGKILDKTLGFVKYKREITTYRDATIRQRDWEEIYDFPHIRNNLKTQAARCMDCGIPFCQSNSHGCPLGNIIPKWNDLVFNGDWKEALNQLLQTNNFPEFTGRVCPAPCEGACVLGISEPPVMIKSIECSIIDYGFEQGWIIPEIPETRTGKRVAIVGSGPSGMAAAQQLNRAGHLVTVYERNNRVGGLLQYGIPSMKLSKQVVQRRVDLMTDEGILFHTNTSIGKDIKAGDLLTKFDAVVLTTGATAPRDLPIENRQLKGIHFAMEFLESVQKGQMGDKIESISAKGKDVIIIGGGDTGCDCIATSLRQGAKTITTFEILPEPPKSRAHDNPWPQWPKVFRIDYGHEEVRVKSDKDPRQYATTSKKFVGENGCVKGINTIQVQWTQKENGQWSMQEAAGTEKYFPADLVLLAMGFLGPEKTIAEELGLELDPRGNIKNVNGLYGSSNPRVFAAGDCRRGQSLVVWAISEGRQAARQVDTYLTGTPSTLPGPGGVIDLKN